MAKLPDTFVKAPAEAAKPRRSKKASMVAEAPRDLRDIVLRLDDAELDALEAALAELRAAGLELTLEQMIHRVLHDWTAARTAPAKVEPATPAAQTAPRREEALFDRLRAFAAAPLRTWRELGATLRRMSGLRA